MPGIRMLSNPQKGSVAVQGWYDYVSRSGTFLFLDTLSTYLFQVRFAPMLHKFFPFMVFATVVFTTGHTVYIFYGCILPWCPRQFGNFNCGLNRRGDSQKRIII